MPLYRKLLSAFAALLFGAGVVYIGIQNNYIPLFPVAQQDASSNLSVTPSDTLANNHSPTPTLIECKVNGKTIFTKTREDCSLLQQSPDSNNSQTRRTPPCSLIPRGMPIPCVPGF